MQRTTLHWKLHKHIRFNSCVQSATWDMKANRWSITVQETDDDLTSGKRQYIFLSTYLVFAVGQLNAPLIPPFPGLEKFHGEVWHSARWRLSYSLHDRHVAVVGNGATGVQLIPEVASQAKHVTVFQRSPSWILPRFDKPLSSFWRKCYLLFPALWRFERIRCLVMGDQRYLALENEPLAEIGAKYAKLHLQQQIPHNPKLRAALIPRYPFGCKRVLLSDDFYPTLSQHNVTLETRPIEKIGPTEITVVGGHSHDVDAIIFATGFQAQNFCRHIKVKGLGSRTLDEIWTPHPHALNGVTVEDLPNFGMLYGPNTNLAHVSVLPMIEAQSRYISEMAKTILDSNSQFAICPKRASVNRYNRQIQDQMQKTAFTHSGCTSWYKAEDGTVVNVWPGTAVEYQTLLSSIDWNDYNIVGGQKTQAQLQGKYFLGGLLERTTYRVLRRDIYVPTGILLFGVAAVLLALGTKILQRFT